MMTLTKKNVRMRTISGTVCFFTGDFGFITPDNETAPVYVSLDVLKNAGLSTLERGQKVAAIIILEKRGWVAEKISLV